MKPTGVVVPTITVFHENESIDEQATRAHLDWVIGNGVHGVTPGGSSGEFVALRFEERKRLIDMAIDEVAGRVPVFPATGAYSTRQTIELSQHAERAGAAGVMVVCPFYMLTNTQAIMDHFRALRSEIGIGVILYNNPWLAGVELGAQDVAALVHEGVIDAIKISHGDPYRVNEIKYLCGDAVRAMYGHDYGPLEALLASADGWLSGLPNVFPGLARDLWQAAAVDKDVDQARKIWARLMPYVHYSFNEKDRGSPHWLTVYKESLNALGRKAGKPRRPLAPMTEAQRARLAQVIQQVTEGA